MTLTLKELDTEWRTMFLHCKDPEAAKAEILTLFSEEPDDEHVWTRTRHLRTDKEDHPQIRITQSIWASLSDNSFRQAPLKCGFTPARWLYLSGTLALKVRAGGSHAPAYTAVTGEGGQKLRAAVAV